MNTDRDESYTRSFVIIWTPLGRDASLVSELFDQVGIQSMCCRSVTDVCTGLNEEHASLLVLSEEALSPDSVKQIRKTLDSQPPWSDLPIIVLTGGGTSTEASLYRLSKMRVLGNITLLERPIRRVTLVAAVRSGLASRVRQFQTRDQIRELEEAHRKLAQANADLTQFAFAASHDLQEPLRTINVFTQLLVDRHTDRNSEEAQQFATFVRTGVLRMEALLRDLLHYSKAVYGPREYPRTKANLGVVIAEAIKSLSLEIAKSGTHIVYGCLPLIDCDPVQLSLVFQNLISNAIKYRKLDVDPLINISVDSSNDAEYVVQVRDNGIGFDQKYSQRIFELFQRLEGTNVPGTGLGLALCRRIVERHGGRMWAESEPGKGSTFLFTIPGLVDGRNTSNLAC